jgi:hypothetical protein
LIFAAAVLEVETGEAGLQVETGEAGLQAVPEAG